MSEAVFCVEHASLRYPGNDRIVLNDICWSLSEGDHTLIVGENGAGKTTLLGLLHGDLWQCAGKVFWRTQDGMEDSRIAARDVAALVSPAMQERFQSYAWDISGREILLSGFDGTPLLYTPATDEKNEAVETLAAEIGALDLLEKSSLVMSQGQLRLMLLGRALVSSPSLLLLDECTDGLDALHRNLFLKALEKASEKSTVIMTTHRESQIPSWCRSCRSLERGRLGAARRGDFSSSSHCSTFPRRSEELKPCCKVEGTPLVSLSNASVYLHGSLVLKDMDFCVRRGECWQLAGVNGSGKSTLLRLLAGDENVAWPGVIEYGFFEKGQGIPLEQLRRKVRLVSDLSQAFYSYDVTCLELVLTGFDNTVGIYRDFSEAEKVRAMAELTRMGLDRFASTSIRQVSTGIERRLFLARALVGDPLLLLLDEPCTGLDEASRLAYIESLDSAARKGVQYIFVSHYEEDLPSSINRKAVMKDGRLEIVQ